MTQRAYETFVFDEYPTGIDVRGINSHFKRALTDFLIGAGYSDAKQVIKKTDLKPSAVNWDQANQGIMIVVGYPDK